jgi:hypothetical protein
MKETGYKQLPRKAQHSQPVAQPNETAEREISPAARKFAEALARRYEPKLTAGMNRTEGDELNAHRVRVGRMDASVGETFDGMDATRKN